MLIPNTFQYPNYYNDVLDQYLTPEESKVLTRAIREIFGWEESRQTRTAQISLSTFEHGNKKINSAGIGLNRETIIAALDALHKYHILLKIGNPHDPKGQIYKLNLNEKEIDFKGLQQRLANRQLANKKRTEIARRNKGKQLFEQASTGLSDTTSTGLSDTTSTGLSDTTSTGLSDTTSTGLSDTTSTGLSDRHTESNIKKLKENESPQQQQQIDPPAQTAAAVAAINQIFLRSKRTERCSEATLSLICTKHQTTPAEILKAAEALTPLKKVNDVLSMMIGRNGHASTVFVNGLCILPPPEESAPAPKPQRREPAAAPQISDEELNRRIAQLDAATRERIKREVIEKLAPLRANMKPEVYAQTAKIAYRQALTALILDAITA